MKNKEHLNEEEYQQKSKKLFLIGVGIIIFGVIVAIIIPKLDFGSKVSKEELQQQLAQLKPALEERYGELEAKGVQISYDYKDKDGYEMNLIDIALNPEYETCERSPRYSDNDTTREYCKVKAQIYEIDNPISERSEIFKRGQTMMILMPCIAFGAMFILIAKSRELNAFVAQQNMPITKEVIEKMAPTVGKAAATVGKEIVKEIKEENKNEEK